MDSQSKGKISFGSHRRSVPVSHISTTDQKNHALDLFSLKSCSLFSGVQRQDKGHKLKQRKFQLNTRKNFFTLRVTEPWHRLPREAVEAPSLEIFKTRLDKVLCSLW